MIIGAVNSSRLTEVVSMCFVILLILFALCCVFSIIYIRGKTPEKMKLRPAKELGDRKLREARQSQQPRQSQKQERPAR